MTLLLVAMGLTAPSGADVTSVGQGAAAFLINVDITDQGPLETVIAPVNLPPAGGGPITDAVAAFSEPLLTLDAASLATSTQGGNLGSHAGFATSSAELDEPDLRRVPHRRRGADHVHGQRRRVERIDNALGRGRERRWC